MLKPLSEMSDSEKAKRFETLYITLCRICENFRTLKKCSRCGIMHCLACSGSINIKITGENNNAALSYKLEGYDGKEYLVACSNCRSAFISVLKGMLEVENGTKAKQ